MTFELERIGFYKLSEREGMRACVKGRIVTVAHIIDLLRHNDINWVVDHYNLTIDDVIECLLYYARNSVEIETEIPGT